MDQFERADLKGQKLKLSTLQCKPEFKQQYLAPICTLSSEDQCDLLTLLLQKEITLAQLKERAAELKQKKAIRIAFVRLTSSLSWETAQDHFPDYVAELDSFLCFDFKKQIPKLFQDFCHRAVLSKESTSTASDTSTTVLLGDSSNATSGSVICCSHSTLCGKRLEEVTTFKGYDLAIASIHKVRQGSKNKRY